MQQTMQGVDFSGENPGEGRQEKPDDSEARGQPRKRRSPSCTSATSPLSTSAASPSFTYASSAHPNANGQSRRPCRQRGSDRGGSCSNRSLCKSKLGAHKQHSDRGSDRESDQEDLQPTVTSLMGHSNKEEGEWSGEDSDDKDSTRTFPKTFQKSNL